MALKKSELYSSLWSACDELRGGMDASQYKDYVLVLLFVKYVSDKYAGVPYAPIQIPQGASFSDMVALKGQSDIGDQINKKIISPLQDANKLSDMPDFNDSTKLGSGKEMVDRLTSLIAIFERRELDFSKNRADGDDILGDAYEYLMRHFATESGKSKGQFYTPAEVSRIMSMVLGIKDCETSNATTVYDPACGSGSLLLKVGEQATTSVTLYGQEMDATTSGLARMNMILHDNPTAEIAQGNTLASPKFTENGMLKTFDFVVANPPFSDKRWSTGIDPLNDEHERFRSFGVPPGKQGDYAYLLHIIRSLKTKGKGACILPHGVLFRGNAEEEIRRNLIKRGFIKGIIGLPANLFYGTGIPACIIVMDKEGAESRDGIFMIDASKGFMKDGNKNRLREMDLHRIVDVFNKRTEIDKFSRLVKLEEIETNEFNLNIPRYIDSQEAEDLQDIEGHLKGGIPSSDIDQLQSYWDVCPQLRQSMFSDLRPGYLGLTADKSGIKDAIFEHPEFAGFMQRMEQHFDSWKMSKVSGLKSLVVGFSPKDLVAGLGDGLLAHYKNSPLINEYDVYQHLMDYWNETMQDDCYLISIDGWKAETRRIIEKDKKGKEKDKGWTCDLIPKELIIARYFSGQQQELDDLQAQLDNLTAQLEELEEEHGGDDGILSTVSNKTDAKKAWTETIESIWAQRFENEFAEFSTNLKNVERIQNELVQCEDSHCISALRNAKGNITLGAIKERLKASEDQDEIKKIEHYSELLSGIKSLRKSTNILFKEASERISQLMENEPTNEDFSDLHIINDFLSLTDKEAAAKKAIKDADAGLDQLAIEKYPQLSEEEIKTIVVEDKWLSYLSDSVKGEMDSISQGLTQRIKELAERYETTLPQAVSQVNELESKVSQHLEKMGFSWN